SDRPPNPQPHLRFPFVSSGALWGNPALRTPSPSAISPISVILKEMKWIMSLALMLFAFELHSQDADGEGKIMLTVILRHDQTKTLDEINDHLAKTGFRKQFPPDGVEILSYHIVMGVGHIITL